jgi:hypothetical protein
MFSHLRNFPMGSAKLHRKSTATIDILIVMAIALTGILLALVWRVMVV